MLTTIIVLLLFDIGLSVGLFVQIASLSDPFDWSKE